MNEDFVSFNLAKKLKEKGFNKECFAHYDDLGNLLLDKDYWKLDSHILAPTISQVLKWLREDKKIFLCVDISEKGWYYATCPIITKDGKEISRDFDVYNKEFYDYNSAAIAGVEYIIDNLI